jgi:predicted acylesterase/phospholipase RssA
MKYLVIGPASMGIFALIGALKSREKELNDTLEISGCSAGSILTLFLALGMNIDKILDTCLNVDIESLVTLSISSFISNYGFVNIQTVREKLVEICECDPTFEEIEKKRHISSFCLNTSRTEYFSKDTHPKMRVIDAVCMSMAIPLIFESVEYNGYNYVDGFIAENYPLLPFLDKKDYEITCLKINMDRIFKDEINNLKDFLQSIVFAVTDNRTVYTKKINMINIDIKDTNIFDFGMSYENKVRLFSIGYGRTTTD